MARMRQGLNMMRSAAEVRCALRHVQGRKTRRPSETVRAAVDFIAESPHQFQTAFLYAGCDAPFAHCGPRLSPAP